MSAASTQPMHNTEVNLPTDQEIQDTFATLGLLTPAPAGYSYLSAWGANDSGHVFQVTRTTTTESRDA